MVYRKDIDGLRAVAVIAVVLFHAFASWFPQGYRGVDIFFVISGFLITSIILHGLEKNQFSFLNFYVRRIKRILPMAYFVLLIVAAIGSLTLFSNEFEDLKKSIKSAAAFYINFKLVNDAGYFDIGAIYKPLLHYWSLAIEEQFYIFWPLIVFSFYKSVSWFEKKGAAQSKAAYFLVGFSLVSIFLSLKFYLAMPYEQYYSSYGRIWELSAGCLTALILHIQRRNFILSKEVGEFICALGIVLMFVGLIFKLDKWGTIFAVFGTSLYLATSDELKLKKIFKNKFLVFCGLISFSLYLWHWPLLSFYRIYNPLGDSIAAFVLVIIAFALSSATYLLIEKPLKQQNWDIVDAGVVSVFDSRRIYLKASACVLLGLFLFKFAPSLPKPVDVQKSQFKLVEDNTFAFKTDCLVADIKDSFSLPWCYRDPQKKKFRGVVLGDSHAHALYPGLTTTSKEINWELVANHSCSPFVLNEIYSDCKEVVTRTTEELKKKSEIKFVLLVTANRIFSEFNKELDSQAGRSRTVSNLKEIVASGKTVVILEPIPAIAKNIYGCVYQRFSFYEVFKNEEACRIPQRTWVEMTIGYMNFLKFVKSEVPEVILFNPLSKLCDGEYCHAVRGGHAMYYDEDHLSLEGSELIATELVSGLGSATY